MSNTNPFANLGFEDFRRLAQDKALSKFERIGFPDSYRKGHEANIFADIRIKLPGLDEPNKTVLDIGPGCSDLPMMLIEQCHKSGHQLHLIDSAEMLAILPDAPFIQKTGALYPNCSKIIEALRGKVAGEDDADATTADGRPEAQVRVDIDVSAYIPSEFVPYEAAKIELHRRIVGCADPGEVRALREELRDRFGPVPEPVEALLELQRVRLAVGAAGGAIAEVRGGRLSISPVELDSAAVGSVRGRIPEALYETSKRTLSVRVPGDSATRLAATTALVDALTSALAEPAFSESR